MRLGCEWLTEDILIELNEERFRLTISTGDALAFAMGWSDLGYDQPNDVSRRVMGALALDSLEYSEQWREAAVARACLVKRWPGEFSF